MEGNAQEIPVYAKVIITFICIVAVVLTAAWGKIMEWAKGKLKRSEIRAKNILPDEAVKETNKTFPK